MVLFKCPKRDAYVIKALTLSTRTHKEAYNGTMWQRYPVLQKFVFAICLQDRFGIYVSIYLSTYTHRATTELKSTCHVILLGELFSALPHYMTYSLLLKCRLCAGTRTFISLRGAVYFPGITIICKLKYVDTANQYFKFSVENLHIASSHRYSLPCHMDLHC